MTTPAPTRHRPRSVNDRRKWLTLAALFFLLASTFSGYYSVWGALFVFWGVISIRSGEAFLLERINCDENPILFWIISAMWVAFGILYVLADIYPEYWL